MLSNPVSPSPAREACCVETKAVELSLSYLTPQNPTLLFPWLQRLHIVLPVHFSKLVFAHIRAGNWLLIEASNFFKSMNSLGLACSANFLPVHAIHVGLSSNCGELQTAQSPAYMESVPPSPDAINLWLRAQKIWESGHICFFV